MADVPADRRRHEQRRVQHYRRRDGESRTSQTATDVMTILARNPRTAGGLIPAGNDDASTIDAPVKLMLDDARAEAARLIALNGDPTCRNTVVVLVVGGGEGTTSGLNNASLATAAANFLNIGGRRVPVYVIAIAPPTDEVAGLQAIATTTGGQYFEIPKWQIDAALSSPKQLATAGTTAPAGTIIVPEVVKAVNIAIQHAFANSADFNTLPTAYPPIGRMSEFQVTSPIIGIGQSRRRARHHRRGAGARLGDRARQGWRQDPAAVEPAGDRRVLAARLRRPAARIPRLQAGGRRIEGLRLQVRVRRHAAVEGVRPGLGCAAAPDASRRNLYTTLSNGTMVAFHSRQRGGRWRR